MIKGFSYLKSNAGCTVAVVVSSVSMRSCFALSPMSSKISSSETHFSSVEQEY